MKPRIEQLFCYAVIDDDDTEGIPAFNYHGMPMPMVGSDMDRMDSLKAVAETIQRDHGKKVRLYKFTHKEEIEWNPKKEGEN